MTYLRLFWRDQNNILFKFSVLLIDGRVLLCHNFCLYFTTEIQVMDVIFCFIIVKILRLSFVFVLKRCKPETHL